MRSASLLDEWLARLTEELRGLPDAVRRQSDRALHQCAPVVDDVVEHDPTITLCSLDHVCPCGADDIVCTNLFTGAHGNCCASIELAGLDPDNLPQSDLSAINVTERREGSNSNRGATSGRRPGNWRYPPVQAAARPIERLRREYQAALASVAATVASAPPPALIFA